MADLRTLSDAELEALRLDVIRRGDMLGNENPGLVAVKGKLHAIANEQSRRAEAARRRRVPRPSRQAA